MSRPRTYLKNCVLGSRGLRSQGIEDSLRRTGAVSVIFSFDRFTINADTFEAFSSGKRLRVEPQVLDLLIYLLEQRHRVVSRDELFEYVWKGRFVSEATVSSRIKAARQLLGDDGAKQRFLRTIHGRGVRFVHEVRAESGLIDEAEAPPADAHITLPIPKTQYAKSGKVHVAYQVFGDGPLNLVVTPGFVSQIDNYWDCAPLNRWLRRLGEMARVAIFDKRGTGLSDQVQELPGLDERMDDVRAVIDAAGFEKAVILGLSEGCPLAAVFAATHPERCQGLILYGGFAKFTSWVATPEALEQTIANIDRNWGTGRTLYHFAPTAASDPKQLKWWGKFERFGAPPGAAIALMQMNSQIDVSGILSSIDTPTLVLHRTDDALIDVEDGRTLARNIPGARLIEYPGVDHLPFFGQNVESILGDMQSFLADLPQRGEVDHTLATLLVGEFCSTGDELGTQALRELLSQFRGTDLELNGNSLVAIFDGPARALECALAIASELERGNRSVRLGVHTGELKLAGSEVAGVALDIACKLALQSQLNTVTASRTVKDLVAGSAMRFTKVGDCLFEGISEVWSIFRVTGIS